MPTEVYKIDSYNFSGSDTLFLDANVWFYIYASQAPNDRRVQIYSGAFAKILKAGSRIFIDALILSEFINRYARLAYNLSKEAGSKLEFKEYRNSPEFKPVANAIEATVRRILKHCRKTESGFSVCDIDQLMTKYGEGGSDFNDQIIAELCKARGFKMITHDGDFKEHGLTILTANKRLLTNS